MTFMKQVFFLHTWPFIAMAFGKHFKLDLMATRECCFADDSRLEAVRFLDLRAGAGWEVLQVNHNLEVILRTFLFSVKPHVLSFLKVSLLINSSLNIIKGG